MNRAASLLAGCLLMFVAGPAWPHKSSDSFLTLWIATDGATAGQWDVALRDLEYALGVDANRDGNITWGELRVQWGEVAGYVFSHLEISAQQVPCAAVPRTPIVDRHSDGTYAVFRFSVDCGEARLPDTLDYRLFFDLDTTHRGLLTVHRNKSPYTTVFSPDQTRLALAAEAQQPWRTARAYWKEGVWHIWIGFDHILFLISLLLPLVLSSGGARRSLASVFVSTLAVVTAFTIAHSLTLSLAVLKIVTLPPRWVEAGIALSVVVACVNNLKPLYRDSRWLFPFGFGLIHGFGFANVLTDLGLPPGTLAVALFSFNVGVETGQAAILLAAVPVLYGLSATLYYRSVIVNGGSAAIASLAAFWCVERILA